jgi:two-component system chemotaxis response regulator CheB
MAALTGRDIIVVAASAGGLEPLRALLAEMPIDLPASVLVVLHVPATGGRTLPRILDRAGPLSAAAAVDGERLKPGRVYVAPPDRHMLLVNGMVRLSRGPRQNGVRPAADPLFRSAALFGGPRVIAVVLSGTLDDGALGSATVEQRGGCVIIQDPGEAAYDSMPRSALATTEHAAIQPAEKIAALLTRLAGEEVEMRSADPDGELELEVSGLLAGDPQTITETRQYSGFTCPDCGGPLYHAQEDRAESYDCLVGHKWSPQALLEEQANSVERALWLAIRSLDERARLTEGLAEAARLRGHVLSAGRFHKAAKEAIQAADAIRKVASGLDPVAGEPEETSEPRETEPAAQTDPPLR